MNKHVAAIGFACLILLGGCDNAAPEQDNATTPTQAEDYPARVAALLPGQREDVMFKAIRDAGRACPTVDSVAPRAPVKDASAWKVACADGSNWVVIIGKTGIAVVTSDAELRANGFR